MVISRNRFELSPESRVVSLQITHRYCEYITETTNVFPESIVNLA
jgi:hypothetical protein